MTDAPPPRAGAAPKALVGGPALVDGKALDGVQALDCVRAIAPYQPGKPIEELAREIGLPAERIVKLASNENPLGPPASALEAVRAALAETSRYPDGNAFALKAALSRKLGVAPDWLTIGSGSNDILEMAAAALLAPGRSCVFSEYAFAVYAIATQSRGARAIVVPARDYGHDLERMAGAIEPDTRLVYLANPNNPTGSFVEAARLEAFLERVDPRVAVVLDEAYNEYLPAALQYDAVAWVRRFPNLLVSRTFSKAYGLAGLRVGYGVAQAPLGELLNRVRMPFNVTSAAQAAACAALADTDYLRRSHESNRAGLERLAAGLAALGLETLPSCANFVLVRVGPAARVFEALLARGVIVRPVAGYGLPQWLRVTVGLPQENERFLQALPAALAAARA
jgi:histidinol-phosphate aminotransferase